MTSPRQELQQPTSRQVLLQLLAKAGRRGATPAGEQQSLLTRIVHVAAHERHDEHGVHQVAPHDERRRVKAERARTLPIISRRSPDPRNDKAP